MVVDGGGGTCVSTSCPKYAHLTREVYRPISA
jgi:hypothetical protein